MHDDQNELASYQPSNEPTKEQKEFAFKGFLQTGWNGGLFTAVGPDEPKDRYANGLNYLDLLAGNEVTIVANSYGYGVEGYFGTYRGEDETVGAEMMMLDFILLDLADELGYEFVEFPIGEPLGNLTVENDNV